jgi:hypothetical protein
MQKAVTVAVELIDGGIIKMRFESWDAFGVWAELNHDIYRGMVAKPEDNNASTEQPDT